jgi:ribonuclease D
LVTVIDRSELLHEFVERLKAAPWLCLDTEADSLHAYPEKLCLVQITIPPECDELIDPLADLNLSPLWDALEDRELIMHGSDYDLRLFRKWHHFVPSRVFDTMIAARLLGEPQFGLHALVKKFLGVELDKASQKADWGQRPLTARMIDYAKNDTRHLKALSDLLRARLEELGRTTWQEESCAKLVADCAAAPPPDPEIWRVKGSHLLSQRAMAVLKAVFEWRELQALAANRPPFFILSPETMCGIAELSANGQDWERLLSKRFHPTRAHTLKLTVAAALQLPSETWPEVLRHRSRRQSEAEKRRAREIEDHRNKVATDLNIDPTLIASRFTLNRLAEDWDANSGELMNWQRQLLQR